MVDIVLRQGGSVPETMQTRYKDMEDTTHALVVASGNVQTAGADVSPSNPLDVTTEDPIVIVQQPTITAGLYAAGDALGGLLTFANAARVAGGGGCITKVVVIDKDQELTPVDLVLFDRQFVPTADNAPFDPSNADLNNCIGYIDVPATDYVDFVDNSVATKASGLRMPFDYDLAGTSLFGQMRIAGGATPTYTSTSDVRVKITVERK